MANRNFDSKKTLGKGRVTLQGSFLTNGASAPTGVKGKGFTVSRTGTGTFQVLFQDAFVDFDAASCDLQANAPTANWAQLGAIDVVSGKTMVIATVNGSGTAVDVAAGTNSRVHFSINLANSTVA